MSADVIRCLVTGATGYVGGRLVPDLLDRGHGVRALARNPDKLADIPWRDRVEVARGDLADPGSLTEAFDGMDVVYYLVHSMGTSADFVAAEAESARNVAAAAQRAGVKRLVYLGGLHPSGADLSPHLRSRVAVGEILLDSGIETVVLQAGIVIGSGSASFEMMRHLTNRLPAMTTPKWVHNRIQPIAIDDGDAMQVYAQEAGLRRRLIIAIPFLTPTIASLWIGLVTPMPTGLARPLIESLEVDAVMDEHDIDSVIGPPAGGLTGYRDAVAKALKNGPLPTDPHWAHAGREA